MTAKETLMKKRELIELVYEFIQSIDGKRSYIADYIRDTETEKAARIAELNEAGNDPSNDWLIQGHNDSLSKYQHQLDALETIETALMKLI